MPPLLSAGRLLVVAGLLCLALAACGRRGALEAPPDPSVTKPAAPASGQAAPKTGKTTERKTAAVADANAANDDDEDDDATVTQSDVLSPTPTRARRSRNFTVPKEPFILDPLL